MAQEILVAASARPLPDTLKTSAGIRILLTLLCIGLVLFLSLEQLNPPRTVPADAPPAEFSSGRAMNHIRSIAQTPHPVGSAEHARVRDYILTTLRSYGLSPEVQATTVTSQRGPNSFAAAAVENVSARIKGKGNGKALMLVSHYDSVPTGPGASDDGAGVATLLETARALQAGPALQNDLILLFTDAEENGSMGARAFIEQSPQARDVALALNFEARGDSGPAIMFETSQNNSWLIEQFAKAAPDPVANSFSYEIYRLLPNDTDLTVFKKAGLAGLNFAYIDGLPAYHSRLDTVTNVDEQSLQHHGTYALALARQFGNEPLAEAQHSGDNAIYFNTLGTFLARYPAWLRFPLAAFAILLFGFALASGLKRKRLTTKGVILGFGAFLLSLIAAPVVLTALWALLSALGKSYGLFPLGDFYHPAYYMVGFIAITVALASALFMRFSRKRGAENLLVGGLCWWVLLMVASIFLLPGASYILTWPLLFILAAVVFWFRAERSEPTTPKNFAALLVGALPGIILFVPIIYLVFIAMRLNATIAISLMVVLLTGLMVPQLGLVAGARRGWLLPTVAALVGVVSICAGSFVARADGQHPRFDNVFYSLDGDAQKAVWASIDRGADEWTSQFFPAGTKVGQLDEDAPFAPGRYLKAQAPSAALALPSVAVLDDQTADGTRSLKLRLTSGRQAPNIFLGLDAGTSVVSAEVNGKPFEGVGAGPSAAHPAPWVFSYYNLPAEGVELVLKLKAAGPQKIRVMDQSYGLQGLQDVNVKPRPDHLIAFPFQAYSDSTLVAKTFNL